MMAWTLGVFLGLELTLVYAVEPWLYGRSTGLSAIAVLAATVFWTWLWGPIGLLLATPMTVCAVVVGRHIPQLAFLNLMFGADPALPSGGRMYQRLLSREFREAAQLANEYRAEHGEAALCEDMLIPALRLAEQDRRNGVLAPSSERSIAEGVQRILDEADASGDEAATTLHGAVRRVRERVPEAGNVAIRAS
jgi:hypothetical protein